jgi:hypothetical protein
LACRIYGARAVCSASVPYPPRTGDVGPGGKTDQRAGDCADRPQHDGSRQCAEGGVTNTFLRLRGGRQQHRNRYNNQLVFHTDPHLDFLTLESDIGNKAVRRWRSSRVAVARS